MRDPARLTVERYDNSRRAAWDEFVRRSKNGTFLFDRDYMDYHGDRFADHSLLIYADDRLIALLPAHRDGSALVSHGGLTYGGLITDARMKTPLMLSVFETMLICCRDRGFTGLRYKAIPPIYARAPAQEDLYALFLCGAHISQRSVMTVIDRRERIAASPSRRGGANKARRRGLCVRRADDQLAAYWSLLEDTLHERHDARPVHTLAEIAQLQRRFPQQIQLYACFEGAAMLAGVLIYETERVARAQYTAASPRGRDLRALDLLYTHLLDEVFAAKPYFDFGTSHDPATHCLNGGLIAQKESFGGRAITQDTYWIDLTRWNPQALRDALT